MSDIARQENIINDIRCFADEEIRPRAGQFDRSEELPRDIINKMAEKRCSWRACPKSTEAWGLIRCITDF